MKTGRRYPTASYSRERYTIEELGPEGSEV